MQKTNNFALVRRPPSEIEKAEPGAKRILSGMITDTLALARKDSLRKSVFSVLTCSGEKAILEVWKVIIRQHLGGAYDVNVSDRNKAPGIIEFVQQHPTDLIIAMVNNILVPASDADDRITKAIEMLARLKAEFGLPIIAFSSFKPEFFDLAELVKQRGIDAFLWAPFEIKEAWSALEACGIVSHLTENRESRSKFEFPPFRQMP